MDFNFALGIGVLSYLLYDREYRTSTTRARGDNIPWNWVWHPLSVAYDYPVLTDKTIDATDYGYRGGRVESIIFKWPENQYIMTTQVYGKMVEFTTDPLDTSKPLTHIAVTYQAKDLSGDYHNERYDYLVNGADLQRAQAKGFDGALNKNPPININELPQLPEVDAAPPLISTQPEQPSQPYQPPPQIRIPWSSTY